MRYKILVSLCVFVFVSLFFHSTSDAKSAKKSRLKENLKRAMEMEAIHLRGEHNQTKAILQTGMISGTITDALSSAPLQNVAVDIWNLSGQYVTSGYTDSAGFYAAPGIPTGDYYAVSFTVFTYSGYIDEIYNNIYCMGGSGQCDPTVGTPISVIDGQTTTGIDFALDLGGTISGVVNDENTQPLPVYHTHIFDDQGNLVGFGLRDASGNYKSSGLLTGNYKVATHNYVIQPYPINGLAEHHVDELYDNITCMGGHDCDVSLGNSIAVTLGADTPGINFDLIAGGWISGTLTDSSTGDPLPRWVLVWDSFGNLIEPVITDDQGFYQSSGLLTGAYYVSTGGFPGYINELYDNIPCDACPPTTGTPITVVLPNETPGIDFALDPIVCTFSDDFGDDVFDWIEVKPAWAEAGGVLSGTPSKKKAIVTAPASFVPTAVLSMDTNVSASSEVDSKIWVVTNRIDKKTQVEILLKPGSDKIVVKVKVNGGLLVKAKNTLVIDPGVFYNVVASYDGATYTVSVDGTPLISIQITGLQAGTIGYQAKNTTMSVEDVCVN